MYLQKITPDTPVIKITILMTPLILKKNFQIHPNSIIIKF